MFITTLELFFTNFKLQTFSIICLQTLDFKRFNLEDEILIRRGECNTSIKNNNNKITLVFSNKSFYKTVKEFLKIVLNKDSGP